MSIIYFCSTLMAYYFLHSLLIYPPVKLYIQQKLSLNNKYRLVYNLLALGLLLPIVYAYFITEKEWFWFLPQIWYRSIGSIMVLGSFMIGYLAMKQYNISEFLGTERIMSTTSPPPTLNISGLNGLVRHPLYFAALLFFWGLLVLLPNTAILSTAVISTFYLLIGTRLEEQKLISRFGSEYSAYQKEVPMLLPQIKDLWGIIRNRVFR